MNKCSCFVREFDYLHNGGFITRCNGTKERETCSCDGDRSKCDFYPPILEKLPIVEEMTAIDFIKGKKRMCDYEGASGRACANCPIYLNYVKPSEDDLACDNIEEEYPEEIITIVKKWCETHFEYPTWNEWLHSIYNCNMTNKNFTEWLNTPISEEQAKFFNIPNKKELV